MSAPAATPGPALGFDPLDHAYVFILRAPDGGDDVTVSRMGDTDTYMLTRRWSADVYTVNGDWMRLRDLAPSDPAHRALVAWQRDPALSTAYQLTQPTA
ncbi:hypothetical protein [Planotetraspora sp. GP83]|uniref:hypothetical protein n=1 Tax=Planotetraspora sp. GP83 TaxID=3156264 RepID=UPI0035123EBE